MPERYPGYDVLRKRNSPSWNDQPRAVIDDRLAIPTPSADADQPGSDGVPGFQSQVQRAMRTGFARLCQAL
jgi:hypothetical protein